jgi:hypothetical protein
MGVELYYNGVPFHQLGRVQILGESNRNLPEDTPQRWLVTLRVGIDFVESSYMDNHLLYRQAREAVKAQHASLRWLETEGDGSTEWLNQTATVEGYEFPADPNQWGTYHQRIEITFVYHQSIGSDHTVAATFQKTGNPSALTLGNVFSWKERLRSVRFDESKSPRSRTSGQVTASGRFFADPTQSLGTRRAALEATKEAWMSEVDGADGTLVHGGSFNKVVRVEDFEADVNDAADFIGWSLTANWTRFPNESNYAVVEFKTATRDSLESGDKELVLTGTIGAPDSATARAKLALVRASVLAANGYTAAMAVSTSIEEDEVSVSPPTGGAADNTDGDAFLKLSFQETYRKQRTDVLSWTLQVADSEDTQTGLIRTVYSGSVVVGGASAAAAYATAKARAETLGRNKYQFLMSSQITAEYRHVGTTTSGTDELVRVSFSYEYQRKGGSVTFVDLAAEVAADTFGRTVENVSGFVSASTEAAARAAYQSRVRAVYGGSVAANERTSISRPEIAVNNTPALEGGETLVTGYVRHALRLDFSFSVHTAKTNTSMRYGMEVTQDFSRKERTTTLSGSVFAATEAAASAFLDGYIVYDGALDKYRWATVGGTLLGKRIENRRVADRELANPMSGADPKVETFVRLDFTETFRDTFGQDDSILEADLSEEIQFSGRRLVSQPIVDGVTVIQDTGVREGQRVVRGSVTAMTETAALAWVKKQRLLPFPAWNGSAPTTRYLEPVSVSTAFRFLPLTDGTGRTADYGAGEATSNVSVCVMGFRFTETLPDYGYIE